MIKGAFYDKVWNPESNSMYVAMNQGMQLRKAVEDTKVEFLGISPDMMELYSLTDMVTGVSDGTLTKGRNAEFKGSFIRIAGEHPDCGVFFIDTTSGEQVKLPADAIVLNEPSRLLLLIPESMPSGEYEIKLTTQYTKGITLLKSPRSVTFSIPVVVE